MHNMYSLIRLLRQLHITSKYMYRCLIRYRPQLFSQVMLTVFSVNKLRVYIFRMVKKKNLQPFITQTLPFASSSRVRTQHSNMSINTWMITSGQKHEPFKIYFQI